MSKRAERFQEIRALAEHPTLSHRLIAGAIAGSLAFAVSYLALGVFWGAGSAAALFCCVALAVAGAAAAITTKLGMAVVYGLVAAVWLLFEGVVLVIGSIAACLG